MTGPNPQPSPTSPPAGWYPNPEGAGSRWWDGAAWTEHVHAPDPTPGPIGEERRRTLILLGILGAVAIAIAAAVLLGRGDDTDQVASVPTAVPPNSTAAPKPTAAQMKAIERGADAVAQEQVRTAMIAMDAFAGANGGTYLGATPEALQQIEPTLPAFIQLEEMTSYRYTVKVPSETGGNWFSVEWARGKIPKYECGVPGRGSCPPSGRWR